MRHVEIRRGQPTPWAGSGPASVVAEFLSRVRVTGDSRAAARLLADPVRCHQVVSEHQQTVLRSPAEYAAHVREMLEMFGPFTFHVTELLSQEDKVYVRWRQEGRDLRRPDGEPGTGVAVTEVGSAVYRIEDRRIAEYWVQLDRWGMHQQLARVSSHAH
ncbi:ester cyclase [Nocardioides sp. MAHUQ-72]|uniref:ester cyclase n=1 Tax=unclassified Nocardioides TaxID=2615069 RepID=UPI00361E971E